MPELRVRPVFIHRFAKVVDVKNRRVERVDQLSGRHRTVIVRQMRRDGKSETIDPLGYGVGRSVDSENLFKLMRIETIDLKTRGIRFATGQKNIPVRRDGR